MHYGFTATDSRGLQQMQHFAREVGSTSPESQEIANLALRARGARGVPPVFKSTSCQELSVKIHVDRAWTRDAWRNRT